MISMQGYDGPQGEDGLQVPRSPGEGWSPGPQVPGGRMVPRFPGEDGPHTEGGWGGWSPRRGGGVVPMQGEDGPQVPGGRMVPRSLGEGWSPGSQGEGWSPYRGRVVPMQGGGKSPGEGLSPRGKWSPGVGYSPASLLDCILFSHHCSSKIQIYLLMAFCSLVPRPLSEKSGRGLATCNILPCLRAPYSAYQSGCRI